MSDQTAEHFEQQERDLAEARLRRLCKLITTDEALKVFLLRCRPSSRRAIYDKVKPLVGYQVLPFRKLLPKHFRGETPIQ